MTILDRRLLPLIETLAAAGADWLVFELMDGIHRGIEPEDTEELLAGTRERVRSGELAKHGQAEFISTGAKPILGDDQIAWAADHVANRLDAALADLAASADQLETIARASPRQRGVDAANSAKSEAPAPLRIVINDEEAYAVTRLDIEQAQEAMKELKEALDAWSVQTRGLRQT